MIELFVGLGNPGPEYAQTRHNAGFWFVDRLALAMKATWAVEKSCFGWVAKAQIDGRTRWLLKPSTYMNASGKSVAALAKFYKINPAQILVAHDELDIAPGEAKLKLGGSHAGHNGLKDIHAQLGSSDYWRLRIGIGHPGVKAEVSDWVLKKPPADQWDEIDRTIDRCMSACADLLSGQMESAVRKVHTKT
jgi:peptidyl-tRNA hydrolase, PTH1 family